MTDNDSAAHGLLCPHCRIGLSMSERNGVEIDYCPKCRGVWLDRGELDKIIERSALYEAQLRQPSPGGSVHPPDRASAGSGTPFLPQQPASPWGVAPASAPPPSSQSPEQHASHGYVSQGWAAQPHSSPTPGHPGHHADHRPPHGQEHHQGNGREGHRGSFLGRFFD
ncbi:zf-TFIIB domain-containing protein [Azospirillum sp. 11R-A]|uniref:TFIIB-type zinc ribbon-containing protein n=1 Tax=Azospirillum sp. 11R-A TaxID=3111634 RepID=UPI003C16ACD0